MPAPLQKLAWEDWVGGPLTVTAVAPALTYPNRTVGPKKASYENAWHVTFFSVDTEYSPVFACLHAKKEQGPNALVVSTQTLRNQTDSRNVGGRICSRIRHLKLYSNSGRCAGEKKL